MAEVAEHRRDGRDHRVVAVARARSLVARVRSPRARGQHWAEVQSMVRPFPCRAPLAVAAVVAVKSTAVVKAVKVATGFGTSAPR